MLTSVSEIPEKNSFERKACRAGALKEFLRSGYACAEFTPEGDDNPRRAYNGLLMAIRRQYAGKIGIRWRHGRIFLCNLEKSAENCR